MIALAFLSVLEAIVALIENSVMVRWAPLHHFPLAVGGRVYFRSSAVYVKEKGRDCSQTADCVADLKYMWWAPPSSAISCSRSALGHVLFRAVHPALLCSEILCVDWFARVGKHSSWHLNEPGSCSLTSHEPLKCVADSSSAPFWIVLGLKKTKQANKK